jgi:predicted NodU family carbamoyl transferase
VSSAHGPFVRQFARGDRPTETHHLPSTVNILSFNPGHDGAIAYLRDGHLVFSIETEKDSNYRYSPVSSHDVFNCLGKIEECPEVICTGGWWPREAQLTGSPLHVGYRGIAESGIVVSERRLLGRPVRYFSSSHERSHLLCSFGMSDLPKGTPCYALVWEGAIGAFYEIDAALNITLISNVMNQPGNRYASVYGLADPTFPKNAPFSRFSDAGKLMALASFSTRDTASAEEEELISFLLCSPDIRLDLYEVLTTSKYFNSGIGDTEFRNFVGIFSDRIFDTFYRFAKANMRKRPPLIIAGGCGLNCDWNTKWKESGLFSDVFVPPVANDSGSAIGTGIDAQFHFTGNPKIEWNIYAGLAFQSDRSPAVDRYDISEPGPSEIANMLANDLVLGWVSGRYEIGPRALGNRSILAAPFRNSTRIRLNEIKQREQFRPIAPVCLQDDAEKWFGCVHESPYMLFTHRATTDALAAVTHVNGTARIQTVTSTANKPLHDLLVAFKSRTGYGVLCNTSLNFNGKGFINNMSDLDAYAVGHGLDGFVVERRAYLRKDSARYQAYLNTSHTAQGRISPQTSWGSSAVVPAARETTRS